MDGSEITMDWLLKGWQGNKTCDGSASYWGMGFVGSSKVITFYTEIYKKWRWSPFTQSRDAQTEIDKKWTLLCTIWSFIFYWTDIKLLLVWWTLPSLHLQYTFLSIYATPFYSRLIFGSYIAFQTYFSFPLAGQSSGIGSSPETSKRGKFSLKWHNYWTSAGFKKHQSPNQPPYWAQLVSNQKEDLWAPTSSWNLISHHRRM